MKILVAVLLGLLSQSAFSHELYAPAESGAAPSKSDSSEQATNRILTEPRQMTFVGPRAGEGYFSHDGRYMIYQSERDEKNPFYQIYLQDRTNGKSVRVSPGEGKTTCAWVHPSNTKAMFSSTHLDPEIKAKVEKEYADRKNPVKGKYSWNYDETYDIFEAPVADALKTGKPVDAKKLKRLTTEVGYDAEGSYSPDGNWIAFASNRSGYPQGKNPPVDTLTDEEKKLFAQDPSYMMDLYIMRSDGSDVQRLTTARGYDGGPFFSPDGKRLTWRRFSANGQFAEIMVMDLKTRKEWPITNWKAMSWAPYFHPSGDYIIFTSNKLGYSNFELFIVDTEGKREPVRVSFLDGFDGLPVFLPSGNELSWTRRDEKGESQIYVGQWDDGWARSALGLSRRAPRMTELAKEIRESDLKAWVSYLASEGMKGRRSGSPEERVYIEEIGRAFQAMGLEPAFGKSFVQPFEFTSGVGLGPLNRFRMREKGAGQDLKVETDWMPLSISQSGDVMEAGMVFVGFGIQAPATDKLSAFDSYGDADVSGKWAVALSDLPNDVTNERRFQLNLYSRPHNKALVAKQKGAVGLILMDRPGVDSKLTKLKFEGASEVGIPVVQVSADIAKRIFAGSDELKNRMKPLEKGEFASGVTSGPLAQSAGGKIDLKLQKSNGFNVVAKRRGSGKEKPLLLGAHGDHLGLGDSGASLAKGDEMGRAHYGADDNASGVAALMEIAHEMAKSKTPTRDVYFAVWSAEELGLLGSSHFISTWKGSKFYGYLNMDMVGRLRDTLSVQGTGSAKEWRSLMEIWSGKWEGRDLPAVSTIADPYLPTDAMAFYVKETPILSFFTGAHGEYHSPRDRYETLNFHGLKLVTDLVADVTRDLSVRKTPLTWLKVEGGARGDGGARSFRLYLGTVPDYTQEGAKGVKISGTSKDSPAEAAGLKPGDVIVGLGGIKVESIYDYVYCLQALKAEVQVPIQVVRAGKPLELKITPRLKSGS